MKRIYVEMDNCADRYIVTPQLPGFLIVNVLAHLLPPDAQCSIERPLHVPRMSVRALDWLLEKYNQQCEAMQTDPLADTADRI